MKTIDAKQAKVLAQESSWGWRRDTYDDLWESPEEREQMTEWLIQWHEQEGPLRLGEPEEVPCGWLLRVSVKPEISVMHSYGDRLVNFWTGDVVELDSYYPKSVGLPDDASLPWSLYRSEALISYYIEQLPAEQKAASLARWDKMPFSPVRFSPVVLLIDQGQESSRTPVSFTVEFDDAYFAQHNVTIPTFKVMQYFERRHERRQFDYSELPRSNVLTFMGKSHHAGKTTMSYLCTYPTTQEDIPPSLEPLYGTLKITPNLSEGERDSLPEDLYHAMQYFVHPEKKRGYAF